ncbi:MAG: DUF2079 domain-containing protein [Acidimicrobiales bacterium]|nr:DUF2079 domain-containing protein [Acidimicrobiales bacterium]
MVGVFIAVFGVLTWQQHSRYGTYGYDMGLYDQGIWLVSRFEEPFMTIRGLNYFAHHVNLITLVFVPFYWLGAGPHLLVLTQTIVLGFGAVPVFLYARDKTDEWVALVPALAYLLFPAVQWIDWWHFHPDALIITPLLFAWWFYTRHNWKWFLITTLLALSCKEDAAIAVMVMGIVIAVRGDRKWGIQTFGIAALWYAIATKLIIPIANGGGDPFYNDFFPGLGNSLPEILVNMVLHPSRWLGPALQPMKKTYIWKLIAPVGGLALLAPLTLLIAVPQAIVNVVSNRLTADIRFHYSSIIVVGVFIATVEAFAWIVKRGEWWRLGVAGFLVITSAFANMAWSPSPLGAHHDAAWVKASPRYAIIDRAIKDFVEPSDAVSANYNVITHLTHRRLAYQFPNPFQVFLWGVNDQNPHSPNAANVLVLDTALLGEFEPLYKALVMPGGTFRIVFEEQGVVVARRVRPQ